MASHSRQKLCAVFIGAARKRAEELGLQSFTLVGATTRMGVLTNPFRDRFGIVAPLVSTPPKS